MALEPLLFIDGSAKNTFFQLLKLYLLIPSGLTQLEPFKALHKELVTYNSWACSLEVNYFFWGTVGRCNVHLVNQFTHLLFGVNELSGIKKAVDNRMDTSPPSGPPERDCMKLP